jgi:signal transduction histidine kinase
MLRRPIKLHTALILNVMLAAIAPLLISGLALWGVLSRNMAADVAARNLLLARSLAAEVDQFLQSPLRMLAHIGDVIERQPAPSDQLETYLTSALRSSALFEMLMFIDQHGYVQHLAPDSEHLRGLDMSGQPFFRQAARDRPPYWSRTFISPHTGNPTITVSLACRRGILVGYVDLAVLNAMVAKRTLAASGYAAIVDADGTIIAHPDQTLVHQRVNLQPPDIQRGRQGQEGAVIYAVNGEARLSSVAIVPHAGWFVTVVQPLAEAHASIRRMQEIVLAGLSAAIALALTIALISGRTIVRPLSHLTEQTRRIAAGEYHSVPRAHRYQEIDQLTRDFNQMVQAINHRETALRTREQEICALNATLEERVARRTHELEAANRELRSFAYVVSHDLKAPLRGISRLTSWLVEDYAEKIDDEGRKMATMLIGRVQRMDNLIDGILQYSQIGRIRADHETLDVADVLRGILDLLAPPDHIQITIAPHLPPIVGERIRITQVFQNLLSNAIKFIGRADGRITVGGEEHETFRKFWVADNGPGIDPKYHDKIFQIFQTLRPRDEEENTGVGLAIVKKIIELYGGQLWVESDVGAGSAFVFTLPILPRQSSVVV